MNEPLRLEFHTVPFLGRDVVVVVMYVGYEHHYYTPYTREEVAAQCPPLFSPKMVSWVVDVVLADKCGFAHYQNNAIFVAIDPHHANGCDEVIAHEFGHILEATISPGHKTSEAAAYLLQRVLRPWVNETIAPLLKIVCSFTPCPQQEKSQTLDPAAYMTDMLKGGSQSEVGTLVKGS